MKNLVILILLHFLILNNNVLYAQWVQTNGPIGGVVQCTAINQSNIIAGTGDCIYTSTNKGTTWTLNNNGLPSYCVAQCLLYSKNYLYLGTMGNGVFLSTDDGKNWSQAGLEYFDILSLAVIDSNIMAGASNGLYISADHGTNWKSLRYNWPTSSLIVSYNNILACQEGNVYHSTDRGANWEQLYIVSYMHRVNTFCASMDNIFAGTDTGVYLSTDNGTNWAHTGELSENVSLLAASGTNIYASYPGGAVLPSKTLTQGRYHPDSTYFGVDRIFQSTNSGKNWTDITNNLIAINIYQITVNGNDIFVSTSDGLFLSTNNGTDWAQVGLPSITISSLASSGNNLYASGYDEGIFLSSNNGINWKKIYNGWFSGEILVAANGDNVFGGFEFFGVLASTDKGTNWHYTSIFDSWITSLGVKGNNLFAGTYFSYPYDESRIFLSIDNGTNWTPLGLNNNTITTIAVNGNNIIAGTRDDYSFWDPVFLSTNYGGSWTQVNTGTDFIYQLVTSDNNIYAAAGNGVFLSTDQGINWSNIGQTLTNVHALIVNGNKIIAGTPAGAYVSTDMGTTWKLANSGLSRTDILSLTLSGNDIIAGIRGAGAWKWALTEISNISNKTIENPQEYGLLQNYPNPFNNSTVIKYSIAKEGNVKIEIYNLLGEKAAILVDENKSAGSYSIQFNASNLPSGIYFYKLVSGGYSDIKKLILLK